LTDIEQPGGVGTGTGGPPTARRRGDVSSPTTRRRTDDWNPATRGGQFTRSPGRYTCTDWTVTHEDPGRFGAISRDSVGTEPLTWHLRLLSVEWTIIKQYEDRYTSALYGRKQSNAMSASVSVSVCPQACLRNYVSNHYFCGKKGKVFPYSLPSVRPGADPGVQAVSPQVT